MKTTSFYNRTLGILLLTAALVSCTSDDMTNNDNNRDNTHTTANAATFSGETVTPSGPKTLTRTSITHTPGNGADALWSTGDKIWVKGDDGTYRQSGEADFSANPTSKARAVFTLTGTYTGNTYPVVYTGSNSTSATEVTIATTQTQTSPNDFSHAGTSGDCGTATATGNTGNYKFTLAHKAAYLCFLPRCMNTALGPNIRLTKIVVTSATGSIAGTYDFSTGSLVGTPTSGASNTITLYTTNFLLDNTTADINKNGAYMVIAPGQHTLNIDYYIKDPTTGVEGAVRKTGIILDCTEGTISDVTAWIDKDITQYAADNYYMWDAQKQYWFGHESAQPTINNGSNFNYAQSNTDQRWYNSGSGKFNATRSAASCSNVNEMIWYAMKGDPRWDAQRMWTTMGHLYKGGMWFKKKNKISGFNTQKAHDGVDYRTVSTTATFKNQSLTTGLPGASDINNYFYVPALGHYYLGKLSNVGSSCYYWSSSSHTGTTAYRLEIKSGLTYVTNTGRQYGFKVSTFE